MDEVAADDDAAEALDVAAAVVLAATALLVAVVVGAALEVAADVVVAAALDVVGAADDVAAALVLGAALEACTVAVADDEPLDTVALVPQAAIRGTAASKTLARSTARRDVRDRGSKASSFTNSCVWCKATPRRGALRPSHCLVSATPVRTGQT